MTKANKPSSDLVALYVLVILLTVTVAMFMPDFGFKISCDAANRPLILSLVAVLYFVLLPTVFLLQRALHEPTREAEQCIAKLLRRLRIAIYSLVVATMVIFPLFYTLASSYTMFESYPVAIKVNGVSENGSYQTGSILLAAISDMHITNRDQTLEGQKDSLEKLKKTLQVVYATNAKVFVLLGDSTDRGEEAEWELIENTLLERDGKSIAFAAAQQLLIVPGNHDIHGSPWQLRASEASMQEQGVFGAKFLEEKSFRRFGSYFRVAQSLKQPTRSAGDESITSSGIPELVAEVLNDAAHMKISVPQVDALTGRATVFLTYPEGFQSKLTRAKERFDEAFPINYADPVTGLRVILMNSSAKPRLGASMGLGDLGRHQLERFEKLLAKLMEDPSLRILVVALHHAPVKRSTDSWSWRDAFKRKKDSDIFEHTYLALDPGDGEELLSQLGKFTEARKDVPAIVAHGHRHGDQFVGRTKRGIWVMEAPAVIEDKTRPWAWGIEVLSPDVYALALLAENKHVAKRWVLNTKGP